MNPYEPGVSVSPEWSLGDWRYWGRWRSTWRRLSGSSAAAPCSSTATVEVARLHC